jgi:hypothetical protein
VLPEYEQQVLEAWTELNDSAYGYDAEDFFWFREISDRKECSEFITEFVGNIGSPVSDFEYLLNHYDGKESWNWMTLEGFLLESKTREALQKSLEKIVRNVGSRAKLILSAIEHSEYYKNTQSSIVSEIDETEIEALLELSYFSATDIAEEYVRFFITLEEALKVPSCILYVLESA